MEAPDLRIVLSGHIDHGKSTLIGRLLYQTGNLPQELSEELRQIDRDWASGGDDRHFAYVLDRLAEERSGNITMDTAQVFLKLGGRHYTLIDAPGHRQFVRNMITGASQAQAALLLVAANEGVREQTRRHCNLLAMLGVRQIVVVVNKMDKVLYSRRIFEHIAGEMTEHLSQLRLPPPTVLPLSAQRGENMLEPSREMSWFAGPTLVEAMAGLLAPATQGSTPAMPVQDVLEDEGGVALGRVESGAFAVGDRVQLCPDGPASVIRKLQTFQGPVEKASSGWCVAVSLASDEQAPPVRRGQVMMQALNILRPSAEARGRLFWMSHEPLAEGQYLQFRCSTQETPCRVMSISSRINSETLEPLDRAGGVGFTEIAEVVLALKTPLILSAFDTLPELGRFTLTRAGQSCAGGIISGAPVACPHA